MKKLLAAAVIVVAGAWQAAPEGSAAELVGEADAALAAERWDEALRLYGRARPLLPQQPGIPFNMGVAAYRAGDLPRAAELFGEARLLAEDPALRARAAYNQGTTAFRRALRQPDDPAAAGQLADAARELTDALEHFRSAIDSDPADVDARANGELAQRWLERLQQMQQQQQQPGDRRQQDRQHQENQQQQQQQAGEGREERPENGQQQQREQPQQRQQQEGDAAPAAEARQQQDAAQPDEREGAAERKPMSRQEARRRLQAVRDRQQQRREELARREARGRPPVEKDW